MRVNTEFPCPTLLGDVFVKDTPGSVYTSLDTTGIDPYRRPIKEPKRSVPVLINYNVGKRTATRKNR